MTFEDRRTFHRPGHGEAPFNLDEAFYSRTDERGVIVAGNFVFQRVSEYSWDELIGAPHKIVRHPDMPKALFWLFWDRLKKNQPVGAYVKNLAKDGLHYWVYAVVVPSPGGYLSARIKPSSQLFETVRAEYAKILENEKANQVSPEDSAANLMTRLGEMGFGTYDEFASYALGEELLARNDGLQQPRNAVLLGFKQARERAGALEDATNGLVSDFAAIRYAPINMGVIASRLEPTGGPINSLSKNYGLMSREISEWFDRTVIGPDSNFASIKSSIHGGLFVAGMSQILAQCNEQLASERRKLGPIDMEEERHFLTSLVGDYTDKSAQRLAKLGEEARRISGACRKMDQMVLGLSTTRVLCCVESARLPEDSESLDNIIGQLKLHQDRIKKRLETIATQSAAISNFATRLTQRMERRGVTGQLA